MAILSLLFVGAALALEDWKDHSGLEKCDNAPGWKRLGCMFKGKEECEMDEGCEFGARYDACKDEVTDMCDAKKPEQQCYIANECDEEEECKETDEHVRCQGENKCGVFLERDNKRVYECRDVDNLEECNGMDGVMCNRRSLKECWGSQCPMIPDDAPRACGLSLFQHLGPMIGCALSTLGGEEACKMAGQDEEEGKKFSCVWGEVYDPCSNQLQVACSFVPPTTCYDSEQCTDEEGQPTGETKRRCHGKDCPPPPDDAEKPDPMDSCMFTDCGSLIMDCMGENEGEGNEDKVGQCIMTNMKNHGEKCTDCMKYHMDKESEGGEGGEGSGEGEGHGSGEGEEEDPMAKCFEYCGDALEKGDCMDLFVADKGLEGVLCIVENAKDGGMCDECFKSVLHPKREESCDGNGKAFKIEVFLDCDTKKDSLQSVIPCSGSKCQRDPTAQDENSYIKITCNGDKLNVASFVDSGCNIPQDSDESTDLTMGECLQHDKDEPKMSYIWPEWVCGGGEEKVKCQKIKKDNEACEARADCVLFKGKKCRPVKCNKVKEEDECNRLADAGVCRAIAKKKKFKKCANPKK